MKQPFIMVHDYGTGSVVVKIYAKTLSDVEALLPSPKWQVRDPNDPWVLSLGHKFPESDIDLKAPWFEQLVYMSRREQEGKKSFPVRGRRWFIFPEERNLWARSIDEIKSRFPSLEFRYYFPWSCTKHSDIDVKDEFIARYEVKHT